MNYFFFGTSRKYILAMLKSFSHVVTQRVVNNTVLENKVPVVWGSKERSYLQNEDGYKVNDSLTQRRVPKMALLLDGITYDSDRKINRLSKETLDLSGIKVTQYPPVPYNYNFTLFILTKTLDDYFQILEQILPYYNPVRNFNIYETPSQDGSTSIPVSISNLSFEPDIDMDENGEVRFVNGSISFVLKGNIYMPVKAANDIIYTIYNKYYPTLKAEQENFEEFMIKAVDGSDADTLPDIIQPTIKTKSIES